jgi:hypothetical protein
MNQIITKDEKYIKAKTQDKMREANGEVFKLKVAEGLSFRETPELTAKSIQEGNISVQEMEMVSHKE